MPLLLSLDSFIGTASIIPITKHTDDDLCVSISLSVCVKHTSTAPVTTYVVYLNGKLWHEAKSLQEAIKGWNVLVIKEGLDSSLTKLEV